MKRLLLLEGGVRGAQGDSARALALLGAHAAASFHLDTLGLTEFTGTVEQLVARAQAADALAVGTGTYWGSWGSPLQRFFEVMTPHEMTPVFLGKPAAAVVTMDSVGGADVGMRLLGVLGLFGCAVPPAALVVLSRVGLQAKARRDRDGDRDGDRDRDVWGEDDLRTVADNLARAAEAHTAYVGWDVEPGRALAGRYPHSGPLELGFGRVLPTRPDQSA